MDVTYDLMRAEAIREIRARGCTTPGVAELLVRHHGPAHIFANLHRIEELLSEIYILDLEIADELRLLLEHRTAVSSVLKFQTLEGETTMPLTVHVNDVPGKAIYQEFDGPNGTGNKVPPTGTVTYSSSDPTVATVDPITGALAYLKAGSTVISASDAGNLPASDTLTVTAAPAASSTLTLQPGAPVTQAPAK